MDVRPVPTASTSAIQTALIRSRQTILTALPLFSTKSRAKSAPQLVQAPHTLIPIATSTISIGPHQFSKTKLFSVEWNEEQQPSVTAPPPTPFASDTLPGTALPPRTFNPITPSLITRLNAASAADPLLATILRKAATGQATSPELAGLARYIEAMRLDEEANNPSVENGGDTPQTEVGPVASTSNVKLSNQTGSRASAKSEAPDSIVIEFKETPTERYTIPSHFTFQVTPTPLASASTPPAFHPSVLLSFFIFPPTSEKGKGKSTSQEGTVPVPISLIVEECPESLQNSLLTASRSGRSRDVKMEEWWKKMIQLVPLRTVVADISRAPTPEPAPSVAMSRGSSFAKDITPLPVPARSVPILNTNGKRVADGISKPLKATVKRVRDRKAETARSKAAQALVSANATTSSPAVGLAPVKVVKSRGKSKKPILKKEATPSGVAGVRVEGINL